MKSTEYYHSSRPEDGAIALPLEALETSEQPRGRRRRRLLSRDRNNGSGASLLSLSTSATDSLLSLDARRTTLLSFEEGHNGQTRHRSGVFAAAAEPDTPWRFNDVAAECERRERLRRQELAAEAELRRQGEVTPARVTPEPPSTLSRDSTTGGDYNDDNCSNSSSVRSLSLREKRPEMLSIAALQQRRIFY